MKLHNRLIAYPITYLIFMVTASSAFFIIYSMRFAEVPLKELTATVMALPDYEKPYNPFTSEYAIAGFIIIVLHSIGGLFAILFDNRLAVFMFIVSMCILMAIEIFSLWYLYSTVDRVFESAGLSGWRKYIVEHHTDYIDHSNDLHRMQEKHHCCGWYSSDAWEEEKKNSTPGTCCGRGLYALCDASSGALSDALSRPPCREVMKIFLRTPKIMAFSVLIVLLATQATLLLSMGSHWWWKDIRVFRKKPTEPPSLEEFAEEESMDESYYESFIEREKKVAVGLLE